MATMVHLGLKTVSVTCYVFPIGGVDIILGVSFISHSCSMNWWSFPLSFLLVESWSLYSKCVHFIGLIHMGKVVCLHGVSRSIVSNRNLNFVFPFWLELFKGVGTRRKISSTYHRETDGCIEEQKGHMEKYSSVLLSNLNDGVDG